MFDKAQRTKENLSDEPSEAVKRLDAVVQKSREQRFYPEASILEVASGIKEIRKLLEELYLGPNHWEVNQSIGFHDFVNRKDRGLLQQVVGRYQGEVPEEVLTEYESFKSLINNFEWPERRFEGLGVS